MKMQAINLHNHENEQPTFHCYFTAISLEIAKSFSYFLKISKAHLPIKS